MPTDLPEGVERLSDSERKRRWRAGKHARGESLSRSGRSGKGTRKPSMFDAGEFVAIDGEGFSEGVEKTWLVGENQRSYTGKEHYYALLAASDASEVYSESRLTTGQCLDFVLDIKRNNPFAIIVCFGGSYDIAQFLCHGLSREQCIELQSDPDPEQNPDDKRRRRTLDCTFGGFDYRLEYRPRKSLSIWRWVTGAEKYERYHKRDGTPEWRMTEHESAIVWDVWGFFQDSFTGVMRKWIPNDPDYQFIVRNKGDRSIFQRAELDIIRRYNQAELRCLVEIMNKLRDSIKALGLMITRWDGAGAIAAAMMKHHNVKEHMNVSPLEVFNAACHAYSGGHIEVCQLGFHSGRIFHYDVNSAYPSIFRDLPSLTTGRWVHGTERDGIPPDGFTLVKVSYQFKPGHAFYPLFYRQDDGSIIYPDRGTGWYWYPEFEGAREYAHTIGADQFHVLEWWHFETKANVQPFHWIDDYYAQRQSRVQAAKIMEVEDGPEKIIKLGLNSLYGKTAQQVGARENPDDGTIIAPAYFQLEWAGYVTASCRAKLMQAALQHPTAIVSFATDGLFATAPLDLDTPAEKILGAWEYTEHDGMTMVMPGVYWLHETGEKPKHYSRGFDKAQMSDAEFIHTAWRYRNDYVQLDITRLIGLGTACVSETFWAMRGMFVSSKRELALNGDNSKRYPITLNNVNKPHLNLIPSVPREHDDMYATAEELLSEPYEIAWMDQSAQRGSVPFDAESEASEDADMDAAYLA